MNCHENDVPNRPPLPGCTEHSKSKFEVDFVFEGLAVEVKAKKNVGARDLRGLRALPEEGLFDHYLLVSMAPVPRVVDGIRVLLWSDFLDRLWGGEWL